MEHKSLHNGFTIPTLGIGTFGIGGFDEPDPSNEEVYVNALKKSIELGYTHIDTSERYAWGYSEELIGKAIQGVERDTLFITSKVWETHLHFDDVIASAESSIRRMNCKYLDLYLIHFPNETIPIKETMAAMNELVERGLVKYIGVSNFTKEQFVEAQKHSKHPLVANQLRHNIWSKNIDLETINWCRNNNIMVIADKPLGRGKIVESVPFVVESIAAKYKKTAAQVILRWLTQKTNVVAIFKSTNDKHLEENKNIFDFRLTDKEAEDIDSLITSSW
ncbi:aldo/keto reductase [Candidatus Woesearchaeota archaeon]|nr:MAG: aldo/keto reductase [Candidatus Woesearchaeota archaeon]